jgi:stringent starvation protein B
VTPILDKLSVAQFILSRDNLHVYLDPRPDDVTIPPWLKHQDEVVLQFGLSCSIPIPDLHLDESGIYGTLSFQQTPYTCAIPWKRIWAMYAGRTNNQPFVWEADRPEPVTTVRSKKLPKGWALIRGEKK